ncbi:MAG: hypothetical protein JXA33_02780, partial [Anaerolineae bacterium]|nr:hypothetical protein [Anaerolineae bacterium]
MNGVEEQLTNCVHELARQQQLAEGLRTMLVMLNSDQPRHEIVSYIVKQACKLLNSGACVLYHIDQEQHQSLIEAQFNLIPGLQSTETLSLSSEDLWHKLLPSSESELSPSPTIIPDISNSPIAMLSQDKCATADVRAWCMMIIAHYHALLIVPLVIR